MGERVSVLLLVNARQGGTYVQMYDGRCHCTDMGVYNVALLNGVNVTLWAVLNKSWSRDDFQILLFDTCF